MSVERGQLGPLPCLMFGTGVPLVALGGLNLTTGVDGGGVPRMARSLLGPLAGVRRIVFVNRRRGLPPGMTMAELAGEHADGIRDAFAGAVDVFGISTGGSIAQQLAAEHPDVVRRLVLVSTACRLGDTARLLQRRVAARLRRGATRKAMAVMGAGLAPPGRPQLVAGVLGWLSAPRLAGDPQDMADLATTIEAEDDFDLARCATAIRAPTLIVAGSEDRFYSRGLFEETAALIPGSRLSLHEGRGHMTVTSSPRFANEIISFIDF
ncbi:MAG TPA: alpha/beta hydrolase [Solirubrobacteraceae bacterium]|nr:alpha/beta hydrolase [Solirubrobacteraceae bacterium]